MILPPMLCSLMHRHHWEFVRRRLTGPAFLGLQRHIGTYQCDLCGNTHQIIAGRVKGKDSFLPLDAPPPVHGIAMRLHRLLGGPV